VLAKVIYFMTLVSAGAPEVRVARHCGVVEYQFAKANFFSDSANFLAQNESILRFRAIYIVRARALDGCTAQGYIQHRSET